MSGHNTNTIFFNKKIKEWPSRTLATPTPSLPFTFDNIITMLCFGVGVKDSPSFKISISSWVTDTFDKFKIFEDCRCAIGGSCDSQGFFSVNLTFFTSCGFFSIF